MHRRIAPCLLPLLVLTLLACDDPTTASGPSSTAAARVIDRVTLTAPFDEIASSACLGEETLTITGTLYEQFTSVSVPGDPVPYHYELTDVYRGTAVGSSGTTYKYVNTQHQTLSQPSLESAHWTFSFPAQILLIGNGGAPNRIVHFTTHTTVLPSGELQVFFDEIRVTCQ
jgi:hypothetical protein